MKKFEIEKITTMTQRHKVNKCFWKKALIDLLNAGVPQTFDLSNTQCLQGAIKC